MFKTFQNILPARGFMELVHPPSYRGGEAVRTDRTHNSQPNFRPDKKKKGKIFNTYGRGEIFFLYSENHSKDGTHVHQSPLRRPVRVSHRLDRSGQRNNSSGAFLDEKSNVQSYLDGARSDRVTANIPESAFIALLRGDSLQYRGRELEDRLTREDGPGKRQAYYERLYTCH